MFCLLRDCADDDIFVSVGSKFVSGASLIKLSSQTTQTKTDNFAPVSFMLLLGDTARTIRWKEWR